MQLSAHLCFDGQCEEAFRTYERLLGATITSMLAYGDSPMAEQVPPGCQKRIVHASLEWNGHTLLGADVMPDDYQRPQGFYVTLSVEGLESAKSCSKPLLRGARSVCLSSKRSGRQASGYWSIVSVCHGKSTVNNRQQILDHISRYTPKALETSHSCPFSRIGGGASCSTPAPQPRQ
jgi:PhnB protein